MDILFIIFTITNIFFFSLVIYVVYRIYNKIENLQRKIKAQEINLDLLLSGNFSLNHRSKMLEFHYANLAQNISKNQINNQSLQNDQKFYKQAKQLKKIGANSDEIQSSCNLSQMEMELIEALGEQKDKA